MRKVIVSMNVTLDGFMAGPNAELDWHFSSWNEEMAKAICQQLSMADTILLGRVTYRAMAGYLGSRQANLSTSREDIAFVDMMNRYTKIVFSKTLEAPEWNNSRVVSGNIRQEIMSLKQQPGKDIIAYGSGKLVGTLMEMGLIDEYQLWVHPVVLGRGKPLFRTAHDHFVLRLERINTISSGVVILYYAVVKQARVLPLMVS